jgi:hypothetical protein
MNKELSEHSFFYRSRSAKKKQAERKKATETNFKLLI